jgi:hypothetical protein
VDGKTSFDEKAKHHLAQQEALERVSLLQAKIDNELELGDKDSFDTNTTFDVKPYKDKLRNETYDALPSAAIEPVYVELVAALKAWKTRLASARRKVSKRVAQVNRHLRTLNLEGIVRLLFIAVCV